MAQKDSSQLVQAYLNYLDDPTDDQSAILKKEAKNIARLRNFIFVELYDQQKERITEYGLPHIQEITKTLERKKHDFLMGDEIDYMKIIHHQNIYLKIISPIIEEQENKVVGYFEGIYHVADKDMQRIIGQVLWSIIKVVVVIFLTTLILYPVIITLNKDLIIFAEHLSKANIGILKVLGGAIAKRDSDTNAHNYRVTIYAIRLAEKLGLPDQEIQALIKGAFLHDTGKIGISDSILLKAGKLTEKEFSVMKTHVFHGVDIIENYDWLHDAVEVVEDHHEKFDGSGYLKGKKEGMIPRNARIFAVVDVFDALTSNRPYKEAFSYEKSVAILEESRGTHFDPEILDAFLSIAQELYKQICGNEQEGELDEILSGLINRYFNV